MDPKKGENAAAMPEGYVFNENVNGKVSVGKKRPQQIQDAEFAMVQKAIRALKCDCRAEIKGKTIVLHTADQSSLDGLTALFGAAKAKQAYADSALYMAMLRFVLADKKERLFEVERMFFSGESEWMWIAPPQPLEALVEKFVPLLDDEEALFAGDY
jgi:hypothetical protein